MEQNTTNKPLRRVGTLTLGVCLIAAGTLFLLARFLPGLPWLVIWQVLPAAGLILLGCEVLYYSARPGACRCDFGSVVLCLLMMGGCFGVSTLMLLAQMLGRGCTILSGAGFMNDSALLAYSLILAINRPIEMLVTSLNVVGDAVASICVAKSEGLLNEEKFNA